MVEAKSIIQALELLVQIIRGYGCVVRFLVQICEIDQVYRADAMRKLEENFKEKIIRKVFILVAQFLHKIVVISILLLMKSQKHDQSTFGKSR